MFYNIEYYIKYDDPIARPKQVLLRKARFGILAVESWLWNPSYGILAVESLLWNHGCGIMALESWLWSPGHGILAVESW